MCIREDSDSVICWSLFYRQGRRVNKAGEEGNLTKVGLTSIFFHPDEV